MNLERKSHVGMSISNIDESDIIAAEDLGRKLAEDMIAVGALDIIDEAKLLNDNPDSVVTEKNNISNDSNTIRNGDKR